MVFHSQISARKHPSVLP